MGILFTSSLAAMAAVILHALTIVGWFGPKKPPRPWVEPLRIDRDQVVELLGRYVWHDAKSMPENPHSYAKRDDLDPADVPAWLGVVVYIRENGYREKYSKTYYTYWNLGDYFYWTMGNPLDRTTILNRKLLAMKGPAPEPKPKGAPKTAANPKPGVQQMVLDLIC